VRRIISKCTDVGGDSAARFAVAAVLQLVILSALLASCSGNSGNNPVSPSGSGDSTSVSFSNQIQPIFTSSCAIPGCHVTGGVAPMSLQAGKAYADIVNAPSTEQPPYLIVKPFDADSSYIYLKITGQAGTRMPLNRTPLDSSQIGLIRTWINQGAKDN